jgi:hypothetical protein
LFLIYPTNFGFATLTWSNTMPDLESHPPQPDLQPPTPDSPDPDEPSPGPSLTLLYSLIGLALIAAIGFALLIVAPFHHRR